MSGEWDVLVQHDLFPDLGEIRRSPVLPKRRTIEPDELRRGNKRQKTKVEPAIEETRATLASAIQRLAPERGVEIHFTDNRSVILSLTPGKEGAPSTLRAHRCFEEAPFGVVDAAVRLYLTRTSRRERQRLTHLVTKWHHEAATLPFSPAKDELRQGRHHDLRATFERVNRDWFEGTLAIDITFGERIARRLMGRHERRSPKSLITINPLLDHPWITAWYLEFLVFHECLHEVIPPESIGMRLIAHPQTFKEREAVHPRCAEAGRYERWILGPAFRELAEEAERAQKMSAAAPTSNPSAAVTTITLPKSDCDAVSS